MTLLDFYEGNAAVANFVQRLKTLPAPLERVACNLCGSTEKLPHMKLAQFNVVRCAQCSLVYVDPRFDGKQQAEMYSDQDYFLAGYDAEGKLHNMQEEKKVKQADMVYERQAIERLPGGRLLEVGCGPGFLLEMLSSKWERHGCEYSAYAVKACREAGLGDVRQGSLEDQKYPGAHFDVVCARYVLEHLRDPKSFLTECRRILKPGGTLLISVPNWGSFCAKAFGEFFRLNSPDEHIYWYTEATLRRYMQATGFKPYKTEYPYFKTSYFNLKELSTLVRRLFVLKVLMPFFMRQKKQISECVISPPFYGNIVMVTAYAV